MVKKLIQSYFFFNIYFSRIFSEIYSTTKNQNKEKREEKEEEKINIGKNLRRKKKFFFLQFSCQKNIFKKNVNHTKTIKYNQSLLAL
jgi:hypothetical protein